MIDPRELRLGNLIYDEFGRIKVINSIEFGITDMDYMVNFPDGEYSNVESINPIPLTEENLLMIGFEVSHLKNRIAAVRDDFRINIFRNGVIKVSWRGNIIPDKKYIHDMQNLAHSLTGQELTITETQTK